MARARWRLRDLARAVSWLEDKSDSGIYKVLKRLGFSRKAALNFIRSPDPAYAAKWRAIVDAACAAISRPADVVLLFLDEVTYYRRPSKAPAYHRRGPSQPHAHEAPRANTQTRIVAVLDGLSGQVLYHQRSHITAEVLAAFYHHVRDRYPHQTVYIVQDNWPTHYAARVMESLRELALTPLFLPTYASWLNPIEKLWRWLRQDVLHLHDGAHDLELTRAHARVFLDQFASGSTQLLRYVGLLPD